MKAPTVETQPKTNAAQDSLEGLSILVVDDEPVVREVLSRSLTREGIRVVTAHDGAEALEKLQGTTVHAVITDFMMPKMDGMELLVQIKSKYPEIPVIMITGNSVRFSGKQALEAGAEDYITKPFNNQDLRYSLRRALGRGGEGSVGKDRRSD
ncbi:MAG: response regulator [Candidatus Zixiibacteriota bacterium]